MAYVQPCAYGRARPKLGDNIARRAATPRLCASAHNLSLFHTWHIITHIFLAPNDGQVRRTVRGRCDCADNGWTVRRTRVDESGSRAVCDAPVTNLSVSPYSPRPVRRTDPFHPLVGNAKSEEDREGATA